MKHYSTVVAERYSGREVGTHVYEGRYSLINPIGFYGTAKNREAFYFVFNELRRRGVDLTQQKILDAGCGSGGWTRFFAELTGAPENIAGVDLSEHRIRIAKRMNAEIEYNVGDVTQMPFDERRWDIITAIDVFMHLDTEALIMRALRGIHESLKPLGYFIWYDLFARDHFDTKAEAESSGYNPKQMVELARAARFKYVFHRNVFKRIAGRHTVYMAAKGYPFWMLDLAERIVPGAPGNMIYVFSKE